MIVVTGAYGFIGSCLIAALNAEGIVNIIAVDDFTKQYKELNLLDKKILARIDRSLFLQWFEEHTAEVKAIYHLGARTDTTSQDIPLFDALNLHYSQSIWHLCTLHEIPLVYASSAATYGNGLLGFDDDHSGIDALQPLNPYGWSKQYFDQWALQQKECPPQWIGLKFFNVYGPNEYHKERMASVIFHSYRKILQHGRMQLFKSHKAGIADGHQSRDFIYVKDIVSICIFCIENKVNSGIYNAGTGKARTFLDLTKATFAAMDREANIGFIDTPIDIRDNYQYFTEANMQKLIMQGYNKSFTSLEDGVNEYVRQYLATNHYM